MRVRLGAQQVRNFLDNHGIYHREHGKGYQKGNIYIDCPFCSPAKREGQYLGIKPGVSVYGCYKDRSHRGTDIVTLFSALVGTPYHVLQKELAGLALERYEGSYEEQLDLLEYGNPVHDLKPLELPDDFTPISQDSPPDIKQYLTDRHIKGEWLDKLGHDWGFGSVRQSYLKKGWVDPRIIIPTYSEGRLRGYTGRSINKNAKLRYLSCKGFTPQAAFYDQLMKGGEILLIQEGSLDSIKFNLFAKHIKSTAMFTLVLANDWLLASQLKNLFSVYKKAAVLLDTTAQLDAESLGYTLGIPVLNSPKLLGIYRKPDGSPCKDTGDLDLSQIRSLERTIIEELSS